jgi:hypothetical protein
MQNPAPGAIRTNGVEFWPPPASPSLRDGTHSETVARWWWRGTDVSGLVSGGRELAVGDAECGWGLTAGSVALGTGQGLPSSARLRRGEASLWSHPIGQISAHGPADVAGGQPRPARLAAADLSLTRRVLSLPVRSFCLPLFPSPAPLSVRLSDDVAASSQSGRVALQRAFGPQFGFGLHLGPPSRSVFPCECPTVLQLHLSCNILGFNHDKINKQKVNGKANGR